jgi:hypothetical protein
MVGRHGAKAKPVQDKATPLRWTCQSRANSSDPESMAFLRYVNYSGRSTHSLGEHSSIPRVREIAHCVKCDADENISFHGYWMRSATKRIDDAGEET